MKSIERLHVVYLEDDPGAVELVRALLAEELPDCVVESVLDEAEFRQALARRPDVILADFNLPTIDGEAALAVRQEVCPDIPFILVSGALGETRAVELLKTGVTDFVFKDAISRLPPAVRRSVTEAREHAARVRFEHSLRESEERFRRLAENAPDVIFRYDLGTRPGRCDYISPAVERLLGYHPEEFYRDPFLPLTVVHPDDRPLVEKIIARREVSTAAEIRWVTRDGRVVVTDQRFVPVYDAHGELVALEGIARDVTSVKQEAERRRVLERQLFQAQKMESIGALAGGIAHDFNNILTGILGFTELAQLQLGPQAAGVALDEVRKAGMRAKDLVAQILTFCRQQDAALVPVEVSRIVLDAVRFLRSSVPAAITIERALEPATVLGDPTQIHQVVLNLCTNAVHAMQGRSGTLTLRVDRVRVTPEQAAGMPRVEPGPHACIVVRDTGHGMNEATLARIFDPFFTTKPVGEGTGLGLPVVQGIVASHRGGLTVESAPGVGTTFRVYLPECASAVPAGEIRPPPPPGRGELVLVVDDELSVATFAGVRLQQLNYRPAVFTDPHRALAAVRNHSHRFAALVTDFSMPGLSGIELLEAARRHAPGLPVVLITGNRGAVPAGERNAFLLLDKPFTGDDLGRALFSLLQGLANDS